MYIKLKTRENAEINIMASAIAAFEPAQSGEGSLVSMNNGTSYQVQETTRSIRHRLNKLSTSSAEE